MQMITAIQCIMRIPESNQQAYCKDLKLKYRIGSYRSNHTEKQTLAKFDINKEELRKIYTNYKTGKYIEGK